MAFLGGGLGGKLRSQRVENVPKGRVLVLRRDSRKVAMADLAVVHQRDACLINPGHEEEARVLAPLRQHA
ncbi:hypothetical protein D3C85_1616890 [compost metagenome]